MGERSDPLMKTLEKWIKTEIPKSLKLESIHDLRDVKKMSDVFTCLLGINDWKPKIKKNQHVTGESIKQRLKREGVRDIDPIDFTTMFDFADTTCQLQDLLWNIFLLKLKNEPYLSPGLLTSDQITTANLEVALLQQCQVLLNNVPYQDIVRVHNLTTSWVDGMAIAGIIHPHVQLQELNMFLLMEMELRERMKTIFNAMKKNSLVNSQIFEPKLFTKENVDSRITIMFLSLVLPVLNKKKTQEVPFLDEVTKLEANVLVAVSKLQVHEALYKMYEPSMNKFEAAYGKAATLLQELSDLDVKKESAATNLLIAESMLVDTLPFLRTVVDELVCYMEGDLQLNVMADITKVESSQVIKKVDVCIEFLKNLDAQQQFQADRLLGSWTVTELIISYQGQLGTSVDFLEKWDCQKLFRVIKILAVSFITVSEIQIKVAEVPDDEPRRLSNNSTRCNIATKSAAYRKILTFVLLVNEKRNQLGHRSSKKWSQRQLKELQQLYEDGYNAMGKRFLESDDYNKSTSCIVVEASFNPSKLKTTITDFQQIINEISKLSTNFSNVSKRVDPLILESTVKCTEMFLPVIKIVCHARSFESEIDKLKLDIVTQKTEMEKQIKALDDKKEKQAAEISRLHTQIQKMKNTKK